MQKNKIFHVLSYVPLLFILSFFCTDRESPAVVFHRRQGMALTLFSFAGGIVVSLVSFVVGWIPVVGEILPLTVRAILGVAVLALMIIGITNALRDREIPLPLIGGFIR